MWLPASARKHEIEAHLGSIAESLREDEYQQRLTRLLDAFTAISTQVLALLPVLIALAAALVFFVVPDQAPGSTQCTASVAKTAVVRASVACGNHAAAGNSGLLTGGPLHVALLFLAAAALFASVREGRRALTLDIGDLLACGERVESILQELADRLIRKERSRTAMVHLLVGAFVCVAVLAVVH